MNSPFVTQCAERLLSLPQVQAATTVQDRIEALYLAVLARRPGAQEVEIARQLLLPPVSTAAAPAAETGPIQADEVAAPQWLSCAQLLLMSNSFAFID